MANIPLDDLQIDIVVNSDKAATSIIAVADALKKAGSSSKRLKAVIDAIKETGNAAENAESKVEALGNGIESSAQQTEKGYSVLKNLGDGFKRFGSLAKSAAGSLLSFGKSAASSLGQSLINSVTNIAKKVSTLFSSIKRIAFYRMIRSAIKGITTALREGVTALIEWDRTYGNNTSYAARTADEISAKWAEVKKSFGAAAMPLIQMVQPALMAVMNTAIQVANTINQIFRSLQGYSTYMKATTQKIGESANKVKGAAKELKRVIFGFDELNILPSDNPGGGGGADVSAGEIDFVETDIEKRFTGKLSDIINNLVESFDSIAIGKSIASRINKGIETVNGFLKEVNFLRIGQKLGTFLSTAIANIDWAGLGELLVRRIMMIPTILIGAIQRINLGEVGRAIFNFLKGAIDTALEWIRNIDWFTTIYNFTSQIGNLIVNLNPIELVKKILTLGVNIIKAVISGLAGAFLGLLKSGFDLGASVVEWILGAYNTMKGWVQVNIIAPIGNFFGKVWDTMVAGFNLASTVIEWIGNGYQNIKKWVQDNVLSPITGFFSKIGQSIEYIVYYIFHPSMWGTDFSAGLKEIWQDVFVETRNGMDVIQGYLSQNPLLANMTLKVAADAASKLLLDALDIWNKVFGKTIFKTSSNSPLRPNANPSNVLPFANGGTLPNTGSLFLAGEQGAEFVSDLGGHTGVMNVSQMQEAVASGNVEVINAIYSMANMVVNAVNNKNFDVYMDASKVGKSVTNYQNNQGRRGITQGAY